MKFVAGMLPRFMILTAAALMLLASDAAQAREYPWCAYYGGADNDATNCGFETREQCRAAISGVGGFCQTNPRNVAPAPRPQGRSSGRNRN